MYTTVLFDLDHTLLDSETSQMLAYKHVMESAGIDDANRLFPVYEAINAHLWAAVESGAILPDDVRFQRFERFVEEADLDADPVAMADQFVAGLGSFGELYPGATDLLDATAELATLGLVTNGIGEVQRARISRLGIEPWFEVIVISGEVGTAKPKPDIFDLALGQLGSPERSTVLMIGDSLGSDIAGGINAGIDTCWYNSNQTHLPPNGPAPTHEVAALDEIAAIVRG